MPLQPVIQEEMPFTKSKEDKDFVMNENESILMAESEKTRQVTVLVDNEGL